MQLDIDLDINPWLSELDIAENKIYLNNLLNIGYKLSKSIRLENDTDSIKEYLNMQGQIFNGGMGTISNTIEEIDKRNSLMQQQILTELSNHNNKFVEMVENITGKAKTSSTKGLIAENFLENTLSKFFPTDTLNITSKTAHEADMQLLSENYPKILIESKNYSHPVPTKEVTKFKSDLQRVNCNYGVFFSFNSRITGRKLIEIEKNDNIVILYVSDIDFNSEIINLAIITIRYIAMLSQNNDFINRAFIGDKSREIMEIISSLDELYTSLSKQKHTLLEEIRKIQDSLNNIHTSYIENEVIMKNIISKAQKNINTKLVDLGDIARNNPFDIEYLTSDIDKNKDIIDKILTKLAIKNYNIKKINTGEFKVYKNENIVSEISVGKTKCKLSINKSACNFSIGKSDITSIDTYIYLLDNL